MGATTNSKVTIHMVASLDGFIAKRDGDVAWLETSDSYEDGVIGESGEKFMKTMTTTGCFVIGSRTYEHAMKLGWPYGDVPTVVLTSRDLPADRESIQFYSGDLKRLVNDCNGSANFSVRPVPS